MKIRLSIDKGKTSDLIFKKTCAKYNMSCFKEDESFQYGGWNEVTNEKHSCDYWIHNKMECC